MSLEKWLLHEDLTPEQGVAILDALGCIDHQVNAHGDRWSVIDPFDSIIAHIEELQRDAQAWRESQGKP
jgi:hypothetical protein